MKAHADSSGLVLALDISTTTIGWCTMDGRERINQYGAIGLSKIKDGVFPKLDKAMEIIKVLTGTSIEAVAIEQPLISFGNRGGSSAGTLALLQQFNGMISSQVYTTFGIIPIYYNVATARKLALPGVKWPKGSDRKQIVLDSMIARYPNVDWVTAPKAKYPDGSPKHKAECKDIADSIVVAVAHVRSTTTETNKD